MLTLIFEDPAVDRLGLLVAARPACDLTLGTTTLFAALAQSGAVRRVVRPHLTRYLEALAGTRLAVWGGQTDRDPLPAAASTHSAIVLLVNARVVPSRENLAVLRSLIEVGRRGIVLSESGVAAAVVQLGTSAAGTDQGIVNRFLSGDPNACEILAQMPLDQIEAAIELIALPHEVLAAHERAIDGSLAIQIDSGRFRQVQPGLFLGDGARVSQQVVVRQGPVVVESDAEIGPFVCLDGPIWIGHNARINPHAWIRSGTAIGHNCRIGGEVEATVIEPYSNKPHDGFLGHSHVGSWVNIAAGTITSNLKATYGPVRLHSVLADGSRTTVHTKRQFFGALIGDFAKTAINTSIPCGARIGVAATIAGTAGEEVAAFTNQLVGGPTGSRTTAEQAAIMLDRMMARRGLECLEADRELLAALAGMDRPAAISLA